MSTATTSPPLLLIVRFSLPIADLPIAIQSPSTTTPRALAHLYIRPHLPSAYACCPLRLISSGALLPPRTPLSTSLRLPKAAPPPPPNLRDNDIASAKGKGKGKGKDKGPISAMSNDRKSIYVHCALTTTTTLSASELAIEAAAASPPSPTSPFSPSDSAPLTETLARVNSVPQGFDRLASAGLSVTEIAALRSQFVALQAHTHTPDTMPSATELRVLEERWLDIGAYASPDGADGAGAGAGGWEDEGGGALEDMLWGNVVGFFWAIGSLLWLIREEGVWTRRRKVAIVTGLAVNLLVGLLRASG